MLNFLKKECSLGSIADGSVMDISLVPDDVFAKKILGEGFAVIPADNHICSPADGTISDVTSTRHAYCITSSDGLEILVHIGIDTVNLKGDGFEPKVKIGDKVKRGDLIALANISYIEEMGYNTTSMVVVTNSVKIKSFKVLENPSVKSGDKAMIYKI
jgi:PTS system sucrose-specific IIC component